jgi:hypothetical protein
MGISVGVGVKVSVGTGRRVAVGVAAGSVGIIEVRIANSAVGVE